LNETVLKGVCSPTSLQEVTFKDIGFGPSRSSNDSTEQGVFTMSLGPVEAPVLRGAGNPAGDGLIDVDAFDAGIILEVLDIEGNSTQGDCFALEPANALIDSQ
jgi:hypothetical protein